MKTRPSLLLFVIAAMAPTISLGDESTNALTRPNWRVGCSWTVDVDSYGITPDSLKYNRKSHPITPTNASPMGTYSMEITITGETNIHNRECWELAYVPSEKARTSCLHIQTWHVYIATNDGSIRAMWHIDRDNFFPKMYYVNGMADLGHPPFGVPIYCLPWNYATNWTARNGTGRRFISFTRERNGGTNTLDLKQVWSDDGNQEWKVRQVWDPGMNWWTRYEYYRGVDIDFVARLRTNAVPTTVRDTR